MPTLEWNARTWGAEYHWDRAGEEWSAAWASAENQWRWMLQPRVHGFLPAKRILEIGPGYGRWSHFLLGQCDELVLVDLSKSCIDACRGRFKANSNIRYMVNDGTSLRDVGNASVDFVFSFDSLVHAELDVLDGYLGQLAKKLAPDGVIFMHHSNLGAFRYFRFLRKIEGWFKPPGSMFGSTDAGAPVSLPRTAWRKMLALLVRVLMALRIFDRTHMRAATVSADAFRGVAKKHGFNCISQEIVPWGVSRRAIDCFSVLVLEGSILDRESRRVVNGNFMKDAGSISRIAGMYSTASDGPA